MNFALFFGGLSVLIGSCLIVCFCNHCKRRSAQRASKKAIANAPRQRKIGIIPPPSISQLIESQNKARSYSDPLRTTLSPLDLPKHLAPPYRCSSASNSTMDSTKSLISNRDPYLTSSWLTLPLYSNNERMRTYTHPVIPSIYIDSPCTTVSVA